MLEFVLPALPPKTFHLGDTFYLDIVVCRRIEAQHRPPPWVENLQPSLFEGISGGESHLRTQLGGQDEAVIAEHVLFDVFLHRTRGLRDAYGRAESTCDRHGQLGLPHT